MDYRNILLNSLLAGFWAGASAWAASNQQFDKAAISLIGAVALRAAIAFAADALGHPIRVDKKNS